ncbi:hypothetical protein SARC_02188 [Sphaeroforma arctica JP610]|uniref:Uncharacterized protein n=1 Tax=Sphaeroforma arctica JP610 TaxID=667725 RepID=A0A0L0G9F3_9EUKA|nr:hypothetical protein SARC_02188 [Sphaeroforma arctica JP610]KNC85615.1 hypothetical protein SARC_02188 [Sphaeroforma arctica JP610]|eukprot:XP_014159517.1 hypothetical protein SARC_02188 [Sphaeroforma arctica JP610]
MLEDPSLDTTLIKDTLAVTRAYLSRVCVCACSQGGTCMCVCVSTPQEKVIVDTWARLLYDPRWEVRDSVVECLHGTIKDAHTEARKATSIRREYLCHRQSDVLSADDDIPFIDGKARIGFEHPASRYAKFVSALKTSSAVHGMWRACTDKDAYVRSSSMRAMCDLLAFEPTRVILQTYFADDQNLYADTCSKRDPIASQVAHKTHEVVPIPPHLTEKDRNRMLDAYFADKEMTPIIPGMVPVLDKIDNEEVNVREDQKARTMDEIAKQNTRLSPPSNGHSQASIDEYDTTHELYHSRMVVCQSVEFIRVILSICKMARARVRTDPEAFCRRAAIELLDGILTSYACCCTPELSQLAGCLYRAGDSDPDTEVRTRAIHLMLSLIPEEKLHCFNQAHDFTMNGAPVDHVEYGALAGGRMNGSHEISDDIVNSSSLSDLSVGVQPPSRHGACIRARIELFKMSKAASLIQRFETEEPAVRQSVAYQLRQLLYSKTAADNEQETNMGTDITVPSCVTSVDCKPDDSKPSARPTSADVSLDGCLRWLSDGSCLAALKRETVRGELLLRDQISPLVIFKPVLDMQENAMDCYN